MYIIGPPIIGPSPSGLWASNARDVAVYLTGWVFRTPKEGWLLFDQTNNVYKEFDSTNWILHQLAANVTDLTDNAGGSGSGSVEEITDQGDTCDLVELNNNFTSIAEKLNALLLAMQNADLMGS